MIVKTFKYRLYPTKAQEKLLVKTTEICREWYNECLHEYITVWETENRVLSKYEQLS